MQNPFHQFDNNLEGQNPFDQFDVDQTPQKLPRGKSPFRGGRRGERTLREEVDLPAVTPPTLGQLGREWVSTGKGAAIGVPSGTLGIPGDIEELGRIPLSLLGASRENQYAPNTTMVGDLIAGPPQDEFEAGGRVAGSLLGPGYLMKALRGPRAAKAPDTDELRRLGDAAYKRADQAGVIVSQPSYNQFVSDLKNVLANEGIDEGVNPKAVAVLNYLDKRTGQNITLKGLDIARQNIA